MPTTQRARISSWLTLLKSSGSYGSREVVLLAPVGSRHSVGAASQEPLSIILGDSIWSLNRGLYRWLFFFQE